MKNTVSEFKIMKDVIRAYDHPVRQKMLSMLNGQIDVTGLHVNMKIEQPAASQHLAILKKANLVYSIRDGRKIYYVKNNDIIDRLIKCCENFANEVNAESE